VKYAPLVTRSIPTGQARYYTYFFRQVFVGLTVYRFAFGDVGDVVDKLYKLLLKSV